MPKKIKTHLISGAGNTFHVCYSDNQDFDQISLKEQMKIAKNFCSQDPADGLIFLQKKYKERNQLKWFFYNNDGSPAEMCGNATRCVGFYMKNILNEENNKWYLETVAGPIEIESLNSEKFKITMTSIIEKSSAKGFYCDTGVPHLVLPLQKFEMYKTLKLQARELRSDKEFAPNGTNVTYIGLTSEKNKIQAVSYERGVEDFTQACGTGAAAAALYNLRIQGVLESEVKMPGGILTFNLKDLNNPIMIGPAKLISSNYFEI